MKKTARLLLCMLILFGLLASSVSASSPTPAKSAMTIKELDGKKIGVLTGSIHDTYAKTYFPGAELLYYTSVSDMATAMLAGSIDGFSNDILSAYSLLAEHDEFAYIDEPLGYIKTAFAFSKSGNGPALAREMSGYLAKLEEDGTLSKLQEKWLSYGAGDYDVDMSGLSGKEETVVFATSCSGKPNAYYYNNKPTGYEVELIAMFCREHGYGLDIQVTDFAGIIPGIVSGKYDVGADGIAVTEERAESVSFSEPDYNCPVVMITLKDESAGGRTETFTTLSELDHEKVTLGTVTGMIVDQYYAEFFPKAQVLYYNTLTDLIFALQNGQVDGFIDDGPIARYISARTDGLTYIDEPIGEPLGTAYVFGESDFALKAQAEFNEFLAGIREDGTLDSIFELWFSTDDEKQVVTFPEEGENGTLRVCMFAESAPACYIKNDQPVGFESDILARFCQAYGYKADISLIDFSGLLNGVASGIYDVANGYISVTEERKESVNFSDIYYYSTPMMVVRDASASAQEKNGFFQNVRRSFERTFIVEARWKLILQGILTTMEISVASAALGTLLGFGICMLKRTRSRVAKAAVNVYVRLMQGMPLLVVLMILYYVIFAKSGLSGVLVAIIAFALNFAAYACEIFGTGIDGVDVGQTEAALALGYTRTQAFFRIVMPQATLRFLPVYKGEFISLVKMTSIVGYIAVQDLTKMSDIIRSRTYEAFFPLIASAVIYFILSTLLMGVLVILEKKLEPKRNMKTLKGVVMK